MSNHKPRPVLTLVWLLAMPLAFGLGGCKKKPPASDEAPKVHQEMGAAMPAGMSKKDRTVDEPMDSMDGMGPMDSMGTAKPDPHKNPDLDVGETPPGTGRDGGAPPPKGHKGMLPMKGLADPTD